MERKSVFEVTLALLLTSMLTLTLMVQAVEISTTIYIRHDGSVDPPTAPILRNGDLYTLTDNITITQLSTDGIVIQRDGITLDGAGYTLQGPGSMEGSGVGIKAGSDTTIKNMKIKEFYEGISLSVSNNNTIIGNTIANNWLHGIAITYALTYNNRIIGNRITNNFARGIYLSSQNSTIYGNIIANNGDGVLLNSSNNSTVAGNTIINNQYGLYIISSSNNSIYHNNFENNTIQVYSYAPKNIWDDGYPSGGNFWSNYNGTDLDGDCIGDTPYVIDANNQDRYPLIVPAVWDYSNPIPVVWQGTTYSVALSSNSTISTFKFNQPQKQISFNVTGTSGEIGYCNVTIPKTLLSGNPWLLMIDELPKTDYTKTENATHTSLYFTLTHASTSQIKIQGTSVVPEFPSAIILPLSMALAMLAILFSDRRIHRKLKT